MTDRRMIIHFNDGSKLAIEFPRQDTAGYNITHRLQELLKDQYLLVEVDGSAMLFPFASIKYIQSFPAPDPLPANMIRGGVISA